MFGRNHEEKITEKILNEISTIRLGLLAASIKMRTFPRELAEFRRLIAARGAALRQLAHE